MKARGDKRAPKSIPLVVLFNPDGSPAPTDPEAWGVDPDADIDSIDRDHWQRLVLARDGKPFAQPVPLWCSRHNARRPIAGAELVALTKSGDVDAAVLWVH